ncbi:hypothetical protein [Streptomyces sp. NBC_00893]|nr:hypothetical protein [Streptomyces sp. NBC_00893]MCX4851627.1 hypothetical protein [Streptomyces sp. NBC_00893]
MAQTPTDSVGSPVHGPQGATLYVIAEQVDDWYIAAGQNMVVDVPSAA